MSDEFPHLDDFSHLIPYDDLDNELVRHGHYKYVENIPHFEYGRDATYAYLIGAAIAETAIKYAYKELQHTLHRLLCVARSFEFKECSKAEWVAAKNQAYKLYQAAPNPSPHKHACWAVYEALSGGPTTIIPATSRAAGDAASAAEQALWGNPRDAVKWGEAARYLIYEDHWTIVGFYQPLINGSNQDSENLCIRGLIKCLYKGRKRRYR